MCHKKSEQWCSEDWMGQLLKSYIINEILVKVDASLVTQKEIRNWVLNDFKWIRRKVDYCLKSIGESTDGLKKRGWWLKFERYGGKVSATRWKNH